MIGLQRGVNYAPPGQYRHKWGPKADIFDEELRKKTLEPPPDQEQMELQQFEAEYAGPSRTKKRKTMDAGSLFYLGKKRIKQAWQQRKWRVDDQFAKDFQVWLLGRDPENVFHPAYVKTREKQHGIERKKGERFLGKDIDEWLGSFIDRKADFMKKLTYLKMGPNKAFKWNLDHYWLFYKYILRGLPFPSDYVLNEFDALFPDTQGERKPEDAWRSLRWSMPPADAWDKPTMASDMHAETVLYVGQREHLSFEDWFDNPMFKELYRPIIDITDADEAAILGEWGIRLESGVAVPEPGQNDDDISAAPEPGTSDGPPKPGKGPDDDDDNRPDPPGGAGAASSASGSNTEPKGKGAQAPSEPKGDKFTPPSPPAKQRDAKGHEYTLRFDERAYNAQYALKKFQKEAYDIGQEMLPRVLDAMTREVRTLFPTDMEVENPVLQGFSNEIKLKLANAQMELIIALTHTQPGEQPITSEIGRLGHMWKTMSVPISSRFKEMQDTIVNKTKAAGVRFNEETDEALKQMSKQLTWSTISQEQRQAQLDKTFLEIAQKIHRELNQEVGKLYADFYKSDMKQKMKQTSNFIEKTLDKFVASNRLFTSERNEAMTAIRNEMESLENTLAEIEANMRFMTEKDKDEKTAGFFKTGRILQEEFTRQAARAVREAHEYNHMVQEQLAKAQASNNSPGDAATYMTSAIATVGKFFNAIGNAVSGSDQAIQQATENARNAEAAVQAMAQPAAPPPEDSHVIDINEEKAEDTEPEKQEEQAQKQTDAPAVAATATVAQDKGKGAVTEPEQSKPAVPVVATPPPPFMPHLKDIKDAEPKIVHHLKDVGEKGPSKFKQSKVPTTASSKQKHKKGN